MPELPEVETTLQGIKPYVYQQIVTNVILRCQQLRWPIPSNLKYLLQNKVLHSLSRRGKYMLFHFATGTLILHLGMSGRLRILSTPLRPQTHDHVDIYFANQHYLRFTDPRRFGALLWTEEDPHTHPLLKAMGPEPLTNDFDGDYLFAQAKNKKICVKSYIMDSKIVAGVGNIYATEALFHAGIHPLTPARQISLAKQQQLAQAIKLILAKAITKGGTTLKDFTKSDGSPGYFSMELKAYGRAGKPLWAVSNDFNIADHCDSEYGLL